MDSANASAPASMSVHDAIHARRSIREFVDRPVPRESLERMLEAAQWAPNHRLTFPWRFFVLGKSGETRAKAAALAREWTYDNNPQLPEPKRTQVALAARDEILNAPAFMYAYSVPGPNEEVTRENYAAVCIACQNMQLVALTEGLAMGWSTGRPTKHHDLSKTLGADASWLLVGAFYIGYPSGQTKAQRPGIAGHVFWL